MLLTMYRGNTAKWDATITLGGAPVDLAGVTGIWFTARKSLDSAPFISKAIGTGVTVTNAAGGLARITLSPADTASLPSRQVPLEYDLEYESGGEVHTLARGRLIVEPDITVR